MKPVLGKSRCQKKFKSTPTFVETRTLATQFRHCANVKYAIVSILRVYLLIY